MNVPKKQKSDCRVCQTVKAEYLRAKNAVERAKEDFVIGMVAILLPLVLLGTLIGRYFFTLIWKMFAEGKALHPGWWVMILFVGTLGGGGITLAVRTFQERRLVRKKAEEELAAAILAVDSDCCDRCRDTLPAVLR